MTQVYSIEQIAQEALAGVRDFDQIRYPEAVMYAMRGLRDFQIFHCAAIKKSWETISPIKTITFPDDYLNFVSIGVPVNGGVFTLTKESSALVPSDPTELSLSVARGESEPIRKSAYGYSSNSANLEGYFTLDPAHDRIVLKQAFMDVYAQSSRDEILLSYVSSGVTDDIKNSYVATAAANLLISYVEYKLIMSMPEKYPANLRQDKFAEYQMETEKFDILSLPSIDELYDAIYSTSAQIKR
jgi:hypothetical protein